mmetsp:Transcript_35279/g.75347  ORF Transcript_35279/g.75347 Transcript_35279/m.75347 type:complete len:239 (-) Transcript_35279:121-837(-)
MPMERLSAAFSRRRRSNSGSPAPPAPLPIPPMPPMPPIPMAAACSASFDGSKPCPFIDAIIDCACALNAGSCISFCTSAMVFGSRNMLIASLSMSGSPSACFMFAKPSSASFINPALCFSMFSSSQARACCAPPAAKPAAAAAAPGIGLPFASKRPLAFALASSSATLALAAAMYCGSFIISCAFAITSGSFFIEASSSCIFPGFLLSSAHPCIAISTSPAPTLAPAPASRCILRRPN